MYRVWDFVTEYSILLITGALVGLIWANIDYQSYYNIVHTELWVNNFVGVLHDGHRSVNLHFLVNDFLMAFFFAIAGKEVWEAIALKNGALRGSKAVIPLFSTAGGMIVPAVLYLVAALAIGQFSILARGWAIPTATDIAFSYLVGRLLFGAGHPAIKFLLLLAIADDAIGLIILALFYPQEELQLQWLLLSIASAVLAYVLFNWLPRYLDRGKQTRPNSTWMHDKLTFYPYLLMAIVSWYGFHKAGLHPALGFLPLIPVMPHADVSFGFFGEKSTHMHDILNDFEHKMKRLIEVILFMFGFLNTGVQFSAIGAATTIVLLGLLVGKPLGVWLFAVLGARIFKINLPDSMSFSDLFVVGCISGIGFTVSLFVTTVAFPAGEIQDAAKMGALFSFLSLGTAFIAKKAFEMRKLKKQNSDETSSSDQR
jgi:NhaA family Na+:H+ antiporter